MAAALTAAASALSRCAGASADVTTPGPSEGPGVVNWAVRERIVDPEAAYEHRAAIVLPTRDAIAAALVGHQAPERSGLGLPYGGRQTGASPRTYERERWYLSISPGTVRVHRRLVAPKESLRQDDDMTLLEDRPTRGAIVGWSDGSRARMAATLPSLDYAPMFEHGGAAAMVTLTLPGRDWERLVPDLATFKKAVDRFQAVYARAWGSRPVAVWKMEFQRRGAPHLHLFMVPPTGLSRGRGAKARLPFTNWLSIAWADIIDPTRSGVGYHDHVMAGTGVDYREGQRFSDPRRIGVYFSKHGSFADKDYQNDMPDHWIEAIEREGKGGARFWGYWQLAKSVHTVELDSRPLARRAAPLDGEPERRFRASTARDHEGFVEQTIPHYVSDEIPEQVLVMRHLRKLARARAYYRPVVVPRLRVNAATGEVKVQRRKVNRRSQYLTRGVSGFLVVNDGEAVARDIARLLGLPEIRRCDVVLVA